MTYHLSLNKKLTIRVQVVETLQKIWSFYILLRRKEKGEIAQEGPLEEHQWSHLTKLN